MARADRRANEYLADQVRENAESASAPAASSSSGGALMHGPAARAPEDAGAQGEAAGHGGLAHAGAALAGPPDSMGDGVSDAEPAELEQSAEDVDEE
eukprot:5162802-Alexandrium_andersonii.AAC.1